MSNCKSDYQKAKNEMKDTFHALVNEAENMLNATSNQTDAAYKAVRNKFQSKLEYAKELLSDAELSAQQHYRQATSSTLEYIKTNPTKAVGIAVAVGLLIGFLSNSKDGN